MAGREGRQGAGSSRGRQRGPSLDGSPPERSTGSRAEGGSRWPGTPANKSCEPAAKERVSGEPDGHCWYPSWRATTVVRVTIRRPRGGIGEAHNTNYLPALT